MQRSRARWHDRSHDDGRLASAMAFSYVIDHSRRFARVTLSGPVHGHEIAATMEALYQDPNWVAGFAILWDAMELTELLLDRPDLPLFVEIQKKYVAAHPSREIILVQRPLDVAMAQMYALFMKTAAHKVFVCRSEEKANELLEQ